MATIHIDGKEYEVDGTMNLLEACLSLGLDIPYFCWHPALGSVGACRQCAVKQYQNADDKRGRLVMSCMSPVSDGAYISIEDDEAVKFREAVLEFLMVNHPHDCPVCEEGGNCHLQDMTAMTGHSYRKYRFNKRTHNNQELGPFINHEMNRCIACYRCVRYYKDYAGGEDFGVFGAHDNVYFGRPESGTLENEFSGNLVEVCPTGVFTDKTYSGHYTRKWDLQFAPSICHQCSVGCNISPGERYGELRRVENRYNGTVNHHFLCDRGRFGYGYVNAKDRPRQPRVKQDGNWVALDAQQAIEQALAIIKQSNSVIGIGSPRASVESNFALRQLVGEANYSTGIDKAETNRLNLMLDVLRKSGIYTPSLREMESYDAVIVLGEDVTQTGARIALAIRQAIKGKAQQMAAAQKVADWQIAAVQNIGQRAKHPLFVTNVDSTRLDDVAAWSYHASIAEQANVGFAIANAIDSQAPTAQLSDDVKQHVAMVAQALMESKKPLIVTGSQAGSEAIIQAATNIANALKRKGSEVGITFVAAEANSMGVAMMGGLAIEDALQQASNQNVDTLVVMENDLYRHASKALVDSALENVKHLIVLDHQHTALTDKAELVISSASFAEADGTLINQEARAQRFFQVYDPAYYDSRPKNAQGQIIPELDSNDKKSIMLESWRWLHQLERAKANAEIDWAQLDQVIEECVQAYPALSGMINAAPNASFRIKGMRIAREPHRYSGRTSMLANINVHEPAQPKDVDSSLAFSMEGYSGTEEPRQQIPFAWSPGWNSPSAWNKFQSEVGGNLKAGDPGIRLIETNNDSQLDYFAAVAGQNESSELVVAPFYHLFGSDELSQRSDAIQERMPEAYVALNSADAQKLNLREGQNVTFSCDGNELTLAVRISESLATGLVGLPLGFPGISPVLNGKAIDNLKEVTA